MAGFKHSALSDIAQLKTILKDQYDTASVIKELIQNADDAGAEELHLGWMTGVPSAPHPLLQGDAFFAVNDGAFTASDNEAIQHLRVGSKGGDKRSIGKFGLGMKSVFHLCEAYFYAASANQPGSDGRPFANLLNPWLHSEFHTDWNDDAEAIAWLQEHLDGWNHRLSRWFCLWIPIRTESQVAGSSPIVEQYPTREKFFTLDLHERLAPLLAMLRTLRKVSVWLPDTSGALAQTFCLELDPGADRRRGPELQDLLPSVFGGSVRASVGEATREATAAFVGLERRTEDGDLLSLLNDKRWPREVTIDPKTAREVIVPDKGVPHGAVVIVRIPPTKRGAGQVVIKRAVFLPLATTIAQMAIPGTHSYEVWLHGCFFLDSGRRDIAKTSADDMPIETTWNRRLDELATLPLLPGALSWFADRSQPTTGEMRQLTEALAGAKFLRDRMQYAASEAQWLLRVVRHGVKWQLLNLATPYFEIPEPPKGDEDLPFRTLPHLERLAEEYVLTYAECSRLSNGKPSSMDRLAWTDGLDVEGIFGTPGQLAWFVSFLKSYHRQIPEDSWEAVVDIVRRAIVRLQWRRLRDMGSEMKALVALLPQGLWLAVPEQLATLAGSDQLLTAIAASGLDVLILPYDLIPESAPGTEALLSASAGRLALETLALQLALPGKPLSARAATAYAVYFLSKMRGTIEGKRAACRDLPLLCVRNLSTGVETTFSLDQIDKLRSTGLLFAGTSGYTRELHEALHDVEIFGLVDFDSRLLSADFFAGKPPSSCDARSCIEVLRKRPVLADPSRRVPLLTKLVTAPASVPQAELVEGLRYLLHGSPHGAADVSTTLLLAGQGGSSLWENLAFKILRASRQEWRCVNPVLGNLLSPDVSNKMGLRRVSHEVVESLANELQSDFPAGDSLTPEERIALVTHITDRKLWHRLSIHETITGDCTSALDSYCESEVPVPPCIAGSVKVLRKPSDVVAAARYEHWLRPWEAETALTALMRLASPHEHSNDILNILCGIGPAHRFGDDLIRSLKSTRWLESRNRACAPQDVIRLEELKDELTRLLGSRELSGTYIEFEEIDERLRKHEGFEFLSRQLLPGRAETIEMLATCLAEVPGYAIGSFRARSGESQFVNTLLDAFGPSHPPAMHGVAFLRAARRAGLEAGELTQIAMAACREVDPSILRASLEVLATRHAEARGDDKTACMIVFLWYLAEYVARPDFDCTNLAGLKLPNADGKWRPATELAFDHRGIVSADLVDSVVADVIRPSWRTDKQARLSPKKAGIRSARGAQPQPAPDSPDAVAQYFRPWEDHIPHEAIGAFLGLLGGDGRTEKLANQYLEPRWSVSALRMRLNDHEAAELLSRTTIDVVLLHTSSGSSIQLPSVAGPLFAASLEARPESLLVGDATKADPNDRLGYTVTLRTIDPGRFDRGELISLLEASVRAIISTAIGRPVGNLDELFDEVCDIEQTDLKLAQALILDSAFFYLRQLPISSRPEMRQILGAWDKLRVEDHRCENDPKRIVQVNRSKQLIRENLKHWFESADPDLREDILAAVREKVSEFQYQPSSIPFELFQNADDAAIELVEMAGGSLLSPFIEKIGIRLTERELTWVHWGRPINLFRYGTFPTELADQRGYNRDLEKMLVLSSSDKSANKDGVTGKFGLGFKSVFLYTDEPILVSGSLGVRIVAGMFPALLEDEPRERLREAASSFGGHELDGTVIELVARDDAAPPEAIFESFWPHIPLLLAFARRVKSCVVERSKSARSEWRWQEQRLSESGHLVCGQVDVPDGNRVSSFRALVFRGVEASAMLIRLGPHGAIPLDPETPTLWVTAPTSERCDTGIAVNGSFQLDVGRGQLARGREENTRLAIGMGSAIGTALVELADQSTDWPEVCGRLDLAGDTTPVEFWDSMFRVATSIAVLDAEAKGSDAARLVRTMLWQEGCGMARLLRERSVLPTRLPGKYRTLATVDAVRYQTRGLLDHATVLSCVEKWPQVAAKMVPGAIVSGPKVASILMRAGVRPEFEMIGVADLLRWELDAGAELEPAKASVLGSLFSKDVLGEFEQDSKHAREFDDIPDVLKGFRFRSLDGEFHESGTLVVGHEDAGCAVNADEILRAAFAPRHRVLHPDYSGAALRFFLRSRRSLQADVKTLATWGIAADDKEKRHAFLRYLLDGERGRDVASEVRQSGGSSWIRSIKSPTQLAEFSVAEQMQILGMLGAVESFHGFVPTPFAPADPPQPRPTLESISDWWTTLSPSKRQWHANSAYHDPKLLEAIVPEYGASHDERKGWITLMLRASLETMGRATHDQHRSFLAQLDREGWLDELAASPAMEAEASVRRMRDRASGLIQDSTYHRWMRDLLPTSVFLTWLDDYARTFLWLNHCDRPHSLRTILTPRANPAFQGGGPDAPPLGSVLGIGACYMLRELVRLGAVNNPLFYRYCYVPTKQVRELVAASNSGMAFLSSLSREEQAVEIWSNAAEVLGPDAATMNFAFDIPLRVVASDRDLQVKLLGRPVVNIEEELDVEEEAFDL